jgi:DNA-directed RNA polymerase subunit RPC12/RpoP
MTFLQAAENSEALARADVALHPALYGCPDCGTAYMIASPTPAGDCPDCGTLHQVLTAEQARAVVAGGAGPKFAV